MAQRLGFFDQWIRGEWADREAINQNAGHLEVVEENLMGLQGQVRTQGQEILRLRAMFMGLVEVLHDQAPFDDAAFERAVQSAWKTLTAPPLPPPSSQGSTSSDPYRGIPHAPVPVRMTTCIACKREVPATQTNVTANGDVCDACS